MIAHRTAVKNDLFANELRAKKADEFGDPLQRIERIVVFRRLAEAAERVAPHPEQPKGGRPPLSHRGHGASPGGQAAAWTVQRSDRVSVPGSPQFPTLLWSGAFREHS